MSKEITKTDDKWKSYESIRELDREKNVAIRISLKCYRIWVFGVYLELITVNARIFVTNLNITPIKLHRRIYWCRIYQYRRNIEKLYERPKELSKFRIDCWSNITSNAMVQINLLLNALIKTFAMVLYVLCEYPSKEVRVTLLLTS